MNATQIGIVASPRTAAPSPYSIAPSNRKSQHSGLTTVQHRRRVLSRSVNRFFCPEVWTSHHLEKFEAIDDAATVTSTSADALLDSSVWSLALNGNVTLREILAYAKLSRSSAYDYCIVPKYDNDGILIEPKGTPPFPWLCLPTPIVKRGKKRWKAADIVNWFDSIQARASKPSNHSNSGRQMSCEVGHGD